MYPSQGEGRGALSEQQPIGGPMTTTTAGEGAGMGVLPGDSAYSTTTISTGVDPTTGQPTTTYQTTTVGAVPTSSDDGLTAGYATYQTYTATTVGIPVETGEAVGGGGRVIDIGGGGSDIGGGTMGGGVREGGAEGGSQLASDIEMSGMGAGVGGGMGAGGGDDDDVGGLTGGATGGYSGGSGERDTAGMGGGA